MAFARSLQFAEHTDSGDRAGASPPAFEFQGLDQRRGERQIDLLSLEEKIDTSSAAGELVFRVFGAIAHFERRLISERTRWRGCSTGERETTRSATARHVKGRGRHQADQGQHVADRSCEALGLGRSTVYRRNEATGHQSASAVITSDALQTLALGTSRAKRDPFSSLTAQLGRPLRLEG
ncbi:recombinase family protein [Mesorhizobium sp. M0644]